MAFNKKLTNHRDKNKSVCDIMAIVIFGRILNSLGFTTIVFGFTTIVKFDNRSIDPQLKLFMNFMSEM